MSVPFLLSKSQTLLPLFGSRIKAGAGEGRAWAERSPENALLAQAGPAGLQPIEGNPGNADGVLSLCHIGHPTPSLPQAPLPALSAPAVPGYPGQATVFKQLLSSSHSLRGHMTPGCPQHLVQTWHRRPLHTPHPRAGEFPGLLHSCSLICSPPSSPGFCPC